MHQVQLASRIAGSTELSFLSDQLHLAFSPSYLCGYVLRKYSCHLSFNYYQLLDTGEELVMVSDEVPYAGVAKGQEVQDAQDLMSSEPSLW